MTAVTSGGIGVIAATTSVSFVAIAAVSKTPIS
jgi:hypothetical protein